MGLPSAPEAMEAMEAGETLEVAADWLGGLRAVPAG